jgi:hypothetical protein
MTSTLTEKAVVGRRILLTRYSDLDKPDAAKPGIITELIPTQGASVKIRLDGQRHTLLVPPTYQGLRYLDEVLNPVPALPMGRFTPTADDCGGAWEGVPVFQCESEDIVILTDDRRRAGAALGAFCKDMLIDLEFLPAMQARWAVFEWEPEDAEYPWTVSWDAVEGDDQAVRIHYLPA